MNSKKTFFIILGVFAVISIGWYLLLAAPLSKRSSEYEQQLKSIHEKLRGAQRAEMQLKSISRQLEDKKKELADIKARFVDRKQLSNVTQSIKKAAEKFDLEVTDFSPVLDVYFDQSGSGAVKPLPIAITVVGGYLKIGRFIENLKDLDYYMIPQDCVIEKYEPESNDLLATITCNLYTMDGEAE
ncbi:MAG: hypothetical protein Kow0037_12150 [Calditrichia bacterium]